MKRADSYYPGPVQVQHGDRQAGRDSDSARVEELTRHLGTLLDKGLAPTLVKAREQVENGTGNEDYRRVKDDLMAQLRALLDMLTDNPSATASLEGARKRLDEINGPKKKWIAAGPDRRNDGRRRRRCLVRLRIADGPPPDAPGCPSRRGRSFGHVRATVWVRAGDRSTGTGWVVDADRRWVVTAAMSSAMPIRSRSTSLTARSTAGPTAAITWPIERTCAAAG